MSRGSGGRGLDTDLYLPENCLLFMSLQQTSDPERLSVRSYTVRRDAGVLTLDSNIQARFYGAQLCIAVRQVYETEKQNGDVDRSTSCDKSCLRAGSRTRVTTYRGSGGRIISNSPPCCLWGRTTELRLAIPAPPTTPPPLYECVDCSGDRCDVTNPKTDTCDAGDKCYTLKLQKSTEVVTVKGCSSKLRYWGKRLDCDYECKSDVTIDEYGGRYHKVCVSCCTGNKCNYGNTNSSAHTLKLDIRFFGVLLSVLVSLVMLW